MTNETREALVLLKAQLVASEEAASRFAVLRTALSRSASGGGVAERARRVDDLQRHAADIGILLNGITRRPRNVRDDGAIFAQQGIQETRLSYIRFPHDRRFQAVAQDAPRMRRL